MQTFNRNNHEINLLAKHNFTSVFLLKPEQATNIWNNFFWENARFFMRTI